MLGMADLRMVTSYNRQMENYKNYKWKVTKTINNTNKSVNRPNWLYQLVNIKTLTRMSSSYPVHLAALKKSSKSVLKSRSVFEEVRLSPSGE
jgi:hypothetical protein